MKIHIETSGTVQIMRLDGRLDGTTMQLVEQEFMNLLEQGFDRIVFDLTELEYISSAGLRVMLLALKKTKAAGGKIALYGLKLGVAEVFDISGFTKIFSIFPSSELAIAEVSSK